MKTRTVIPFCFGTLVAVLASAFRLCNQVLDHWHILPPTTLKEFRRLERHMEYDFRPKIAVFALGLLLLALFTAGTARADELYGRVRGVVTDSTGAVLPGVRLKITNTNTGISEEAVSTSDGSYSFLNLKPGTYDLSASKASFKNFQVKGITLVQNQIYVQNVPMEVGAVSEILEVQGGPLLVETARIQ